MSAKRTATVAAILLGLATLAAGTLAWACPFCTAVSLTFSEEIGTNDVALVAKLAELPPKPKEGGSNLDQAESAKAKFEIVEVLKGDKIMVDQRFVETQFFGDAKVGSMFLILGLKDNAAKDAVHVAWATPIAITDRSREYIVEAMNLPKEGVDRLVYFQNYLEDPEEMLARDAYDEYAKAPYATILALKDKMHHDKLVEWIKNPKVHASRRRLYLTMLGVCGKPSDVPMLGELIKSKDRQDKAALDALVAAYLTLTAGQAESKTDGLPLVEDLFLRNQDAEYTDTYAAIMALRFHGQEEKLIPRERLVKAMHCMLDRPQLADLVIPDLARWEDWTAMDRLVELFKNADDESSWVRVPVINYLRACPKPKAKEYLVELEKIDPEVVKRANTFFPFPSGAAPAPAGEKSDATAKPEKPADGKAGEKATSDKTPAKPAATPANTSGKASTSGAKAERSTSSTSDKVASMLADHPLAARSKSDRKPTSPLRIAGGMLLAGSFLLVTLQGILRGGQRVSQS